MSKILFLPLSLLVIISSITLIAHPVYALESCPGPTAQTDPSPLLNNHRTAKFSIDVTNNTAYDQFKMEFVCGLRPEANEVDAYKDPNDQRFIFANLDRSGLLNPNPCEFTVGTHQIKVKAIVKGGQRVDQCLATYTVGDADTLCELEITPTSGITSKSTLTVSGKNLNKDHNFRLFIGNEGIGGFVGKPSFPAITIPNKFLTPGKHSVSLRNCNSPNQTASGCGPPLCPRVFRVGTPGNEGDVSPPGTEIPTGCTEDDIKSGKCTSGGGKEAPGCTDAKDPNDPTKPNPNPGIATAIGCIHTNPAEFVKDLLKFVIGISGGIAFLMMLLGAFQMLTSAGNPDTLRAGRERLTSAVIGLLFVIFAVLLLQIIGFDILKIPGFGR